MPLLTLERLQRARIGLSTKILNDLDISRTQYDDFIVGNNGNDKLQHHAPPLITPDVNLLTYNVSWHQ
jgi:hypothetical protein